MYVSSSATVPNFRIIIFGATSGTGRISASGANQISPLGTPTFRNETTRPTKQADSRDNILWMGPINQRLHSHSHIAHNSTPDHELLKRLSDLPQLLSQEPQNHTASI